MTDPGLWLLLGAAIVIVVGLWVTLSNVIGTVRDAARTRKRRNDADNQGGT